ncbi:MAG: flagellar export protein FliJ [Thermobacillus sp. ZCTH02-B1]|uniref:flagellar export protein FliJ n=1 Tax=Thermobacillus sp. ZCTH02-B1 TaxID=1858795 RepID=UPI000B581A26|nr:flagellar export protein FliJ [Thermobacillus sp. ZCTH02-B1]OUM96980.1 MAG: flagellar export protein FliJ [Thermobacillus sp. ZCTH02-B1]
MAKYRYPYQKIVDLKSSEKTQAEWLLAAAVGKLEQEERTLERLEEERAAWLGRMQTEAASGASLAEIQMMQSYIEYLDAAIRRQQENVRLAREEKERRREHLADRMIDEKVWLKARERDFRHFMLMQQRSEQNELDEIASVRFVITAN